MNKILTIYVCSNCDAQFPKWSGRCLSCGAWGTMQNQTIDQKSIKVKGLDVNPAQIFDLSSDKIKKIDRIKTNISEVDRVLGNGLVPGSLILLGGEPGIGKSTIVTQIAQTVKKEVVYVSGEESLNQVSQRFKRLNYNKQNIKKIEDSIIQSKLIIKSKV